MTGMTSSPAGPKYGTLRSVTALALGLGALMLVVACLRTTTESMTPMPSLGDTVAISPDDQVPVPDGYDVGGGQQALSLVKGASPDPVDAGARLTYTIRVTNSGGARWQGILTDTLPPSVTLAQPAGGAVALPSGGRGLTWTVDVSALGVWSRTFAVTVAGTYAGLLTNVVELAGDKGPVAVYTATSTAVRPHRVALPIVLRDARAETTISGEYVRLPNPCTTEPCLPGLVYAVLAGDTAHYLTLEGSWLWLNQAWDGYTPELGDLVRVTGHVSRRLDVWGEPFYTIEVISLEPALRPPVTPPNVVITELVAYSVGDEDPGEYVAICNDEGSPVPLVGWTLRSAVRGRAFTFPNYVMEPGQCCRVYTNEEHPEWCGLSFGSEVDIWSYEQDCAYLRDGQGILVDATCTCEAHSATMTLGATATTLQMGERVTVTATLFNHGCTLVGVPKYTLRVTTEPPQPVLTPSEPEPVLNSVGIWAGQSDAASFVLEAAGTGQAVVAAQVSYEVHVGYPGPAYWSVSSAGPLTITVEP